MPLPYNYFVKTTTIVSAASNSNDGHDPLGCALVNASYDHTGGGSGERQLTAASGTPFTNVQAGDSIWLMNAAGGVADGLYEIASVPSSTVILLEDDAGLTADSTGDVDSSSGPWLTLQYAFDTVATGGNQLVICADGDGGSGQWLANNSVDNVFNVDSGAPSTVQPITYRGGSARGVVDGTVAVIDGTGLTYPECAITVSGTTTYRRWIDLRFTGTTLGHNIYCAVTTATNHQFLRCRFDDAAGAGCASRSHDWHFVDCEFDSNGTWGKMPDTPTRVGAGRGNFLRCRFHDNGSGGLQIADQSMVSQCLFYDNTGPGLRFYGRTINAIIDGCVFAFNNQDGIDGTGPFTLAPPFIASNNIFRSNGAYGIGLGFSLPLGVTGAYFAEIDYNCFSNNTSGNLTEVTQADIVGSPTGDHNVYDNPDFVSETDGSEDFDLQSGSPCVYTGLAVPDA